MNTAPERLPGKIRGEDMDAEHEFAETDEYVFAVPPFSAVDVVCLHCDKGALTILMAW